MNVTTLEYLQALYSNATDGDIVLVKECRKSVAATFKTNELEECAAFIEQHKKELFIKVNLMDHSQTLSRSQYGIGGTKEVHTIVSFHLDVDAGKDDRYLTRSNMLEAIGKMPHEPSMIVESNGDSGGFHMYWILQKPHCIVSDVERDEIGQLAKGWLAELQKNVRSVSHEEPECNEDEIAEGSIDKKVDSTANLDRLLRPVGSLRKSGNRVRVFLTSKNRYTLSDFRLQPTEPEKPAFVPTRLDGESPIEKYLQSVGWNSPEAILHRQGYTHLHDGFWIRPGSQSGQPTGEVYIANGQRGFTVKSGAADPLTNMNENGTSGKWYSCAALYVAFDHQNDWKKAATFCREQLELTLQPVDLSKMVPDADAAVRKHQELVTKRNSERKFNVYSIPGFVDELMQITLDSAPYPNKPLAFCGALSLLSLVVARRVSFNGLFPNIYLLGLANSGSGKDHPRKVNNFALNDCGMSACLGDAFASGEGLEEAMYRNGAMLFQCDEFDSIVRSMANEKESRFESITERLLRFYSSSSVTYMMRQKANDEGQRSILRPHLSLFATCVPSSFIDSISRKMATSGLLARMLVVNAGKRGQGQRPKRIEISDSIKDQINQCQQLGCEFGNLSSLNPVPMELQAESNEVHVELDRVRNYFDEMYDQRFEKGDEGGMAIWARAYENTCKLAILYACSQDSFGPLITKEGVLWARSFVDHHVNAMLDFVDEGMSESPFDKLVNRIRSKIGSTETGISRSHLLRFSKVDRKEFDSVIETLVGREEVVTVQQVTQGRTGLHYVLA